MEELICRFEKIRSEITEQLNDNETVSVNRVSKNINYYRRALYSDVELFKMELEEYLGEETEKVGSEKDKDASKISPMRTDISKTSPMNRSDRGERGDVVSPYKKVVSNNNINSMSNNTNNNDIGNKNSDNIDNTDDIENESSSIYRNTYNDIDTHPSTDRDRLLDTKPVKSDQKTSAYTIITDSDREEGEGADKSTVLSVTKNVLSLSKNVLLSKNTPKNVFAEHSDDYAVISRMIDECSMLSADFGLKFAQRKPHWHDFLDSVVRFSGVCVALVVMAILVAPLTMLIKPLSYHLARRGLFSPRSHPVVIIKRVVGYALLMAAGVVVVCVGDDNNEIERSSDGERGERGRDDDIESNINSSHSNNNNSISNGGEDGPSKLRPRGLNSPVSKESTPFSPTFAPSHPSSSHPSSPSSLTPLFSSLFFPSSLYPIEWPSKPTESVMACFSHSSSLDAFIISAVLPVWNHALSKAELFLIPFFSCLLSALGGVAIDRRNRERAIRTMHRISGRSAVQSIVKNTGGGVSTYVQDRDSDGGFESEYELEVEEGGKGGKGDKGKGEKGEKLSVLKRNNSFTKKNTGANSSSNININNISYNSNNSNSSSSNSNSNSKSRCMDCIVVAPEGTRSLSGQLLPFKKGPFYLWQQMGGAETDKQDDNVEKISRVVVPVVIFGAFDLHPPPPVGSFMTMSGKVIVKFLKPIHESEVQGPSFSLFQGSGGWKRIPNMGNKNYKDSVLFGGGLGEQLSEEDNEGEGGGKNKGIPGLGSGLGGGIGGESGSKAGLSGLGGVDPSVARERMARLVRYRMLQAMRKSPLEAGAPLTWLERICCVSVLVFLLSVAAQSAITSHFVLREVLGLSVQTITLSLLTITILGTVAVYFMQLLG